MDEVTRLFRFWIQEGWKLRRSENPYMASHLAEYRKRLKHEVKVIEDKSFESYFCMVSDIIRWAKSQDIAVGPGRGSSAGSLVCYLLRITEIDPMQYPMLFERFLDPTRTDEPDIDTDYEDSRRNEVMEYAASKYGEDRVANIINFVRYRGKNSLDDVARVYNVPKWQVEQVKSKLLERAEGHPRAMKTIEDTYNSFEDIKRIMDEARGLKYAMELEGNYRGLNVHAAGLVIGSVPLNEVTATYQREIAGRVGWGIAYDKRDATYLGLLKIDVLGLQTMGMIAEVCKWSHKLYPKGITLQELYRVPLDDDMVLNAFRKGDVLGIFQFEGNATRRILKKVGPTRFMHLADVNALSRPGANDKDYISIKRSIDEGEIEGPEPKAHKIIDEHTGFTYGEIVYEEQILMILRDLGGFQPAELNKLRKVIHDKLGSTAFNEYYERFAKGAAAHGLSEDTAQSIWEGMVSASGYAFCVTGDTLVERGGVGGSGFDTSPKITVAELYSRQESNTPIGKKIRSGRLNLLSMDDDGRIRPNKLVKIHAPVQYRCLKITTAGGRTLTMSNDHKLLTVNDGYKVAVSLEIGDEVIVDLGWAARDLERIQDLTKVRTEGYKEWDGIKGEGNPGFIDGRTEMLRETQDFVWKRDGAKCCHCGKPWEGTSHDLEYAHIMTLEVCDGDYSKYHSPNNVMLLCNSCHKKFDYQIQGSRNKRWSRGRPTGTDIIVSIKDVGLQDVYDISMEGPSHNYIGNEFVNHNNIAHSVSYATIGYWQMYLKIHYPAAFYAGQLLKCPNDAAGLQRRTRLIQEAMRQGIEVIPPDPVLSQANWEVVKNEEGRYVIVAGFLSIPGVGPRTAESMIAYRNMVLYKSIPAVADSERYLDVEEVELW